MQNKLLPCPFCGMTIMNIRNRGGVLSFAVDCGKCQAMTKYFSTEEEAIAAWNTRKPMGEIASKVQQVVWDSCSGDEYKYASKEIERIFDEVYVEGGVEDATN